MNRMAIRPARTADAAALAAVGHLAANGFRSVVLWVLAGNRRARRFYERHGWRADGGVGDYAGAPKLRYRLEEAHGRAHRGAEGAEARDGEKARGAVYE